MKYCPSEGCKKAWGYWDNEGDYCRVCGTELTPYIDCLCGKPNKATYNPNALPAFAACCGAKITEAFLGQCMAKQLKEMLKAVGGGDVSN